MSDMKDYDLDVVMSQVGYHLHEYTDGRLAKLASTLPEGSEERSLLDNLVGTLRIVDDSTRIALAQESLRKRDDLHDKGFDEMLARIMQEVMFGLLTNSDLDSHSRGIMYGILHKTLYGTEPGTVLENQEVEYLHALAEDAAEDKWSRMIDEETDNLVYGPERRSRERLLTDFTQYAEVLVHYVTTDEPMEDMDRQSMRWAIRGLRYSVQYFKDNPVAANPLEQGEQPLVLDDAGIIRFRENRIIRLLLDAGPFDLNQIALMAFSDQERQLLAQLIGYSVSGYGDLPYAFGEPTARADRAVDIFVEEQESGGGE